MRKALFLLLLLLLSPPAAAIEPDYSKDPVVMVHGYFLGDVGSWTWMKSRLVQEGWPPEYLYSFQFKDVFGCNPDHGHELKAVVDKALAETGREKVDLLCHSMGCVDGRYFVKFLCGYEVVRDFVSIAGAHKGSVMGCLEPFSCGAEAMCVGPQEGAWMQSDFFLPLNWCDITPGKAIRYTSIWTPLDEIIVPQENSIIEGAWNVKLQALAEHGLILANEETATHVIAGLNGAGTNDNLPTAPPPCVTLCTLPDEPEPPPEEPVESVEPVPDVVEAPGEIVPESDLPPAPDAAAPETAGLPETGGVPEAVAGPETGAAADGPAGAGAELPPAEDDAAGAQQPLHSLPARDSDGCSAGPTSPAMPWLLLLPLFLVAFRRKVD
jgi:triacylglycerol lipase